MADDQQVESREVARDDIPEERVQQLIDSSTLMGDLRTAILDRLRAMPKPYTVMSEVEQQDMIDGVENVARDLVTRACTLIASNGRTAISATLEQCTVKDGIKAVLKLPRSDAHRDQLIDSVGGVVLIVVADSSRYMGQKAPDKPTPQEPALPLTDAAPGTEANNVTQLRTPEPEQQPES